MILVNPTYESLREQLSKPEELMANGTLIHRGRNELRVAEIKGIRVCIKQYRIPNALRSFMYRYLRAPKGLRAWRNTIGLRKAGFDAPEQIAYIQENTPLGIGHSYFICLYQEGRTLYQWGDQPLNAIRNDIIALAQWTAQLHEKGWIHKDFTPGNILLTEKGFALVDLNRMRRGHITLHGGLENMAGLWLQPNAAALLAQEYAKARHDHHPEKAIEWMTQYRRCFWRRFTDRHGLKDLIVHTDVDGSRYSYHFNSTLQ